MPHKKTSLAKIRLVFVDDHPVVTRGLVTFLSTEASFQIIATANLGSEAAEMAKKHQPDVLLLDLLLPDQPAVKTVSEIKQVSPNTKVIILTSHEGDEYFSAVMRAGALSYILKDISPTDLVSTIKKAASGKAVLSQRILQSLDEKDSFHQDLTDREMEIAKLISCGLSNLEIANQLGIAEKTVKSHVGSILSKLHLDDRTQVSIYAWCNKLVDKDFLKKNHPMLLIK